MAFKIKRSRTRMDSCVSTETQATTISSTSEDTPPDETKANLDDLDETFHLLEDVNTCVSNSTNQLDDEGSQTLRKNVYSMQTSHMDDIRRQKLRRSAQRSISNQDLNSTHTYQSVLPDSINSQAGGQRANRPVSFTLDGDGVGLPIVHQNIDRSRQPRPIRKRRHTESELQGTEHVHINQTPMHESRTTSALFTIGNCQVAINSPDGPRSPTPVDTTVNISPEGFHETRAFTRTTSGSASPNITPLPPPVVPTYIEQDPVCCPCCKINFSYKRWFSIMCAINIVMLLINAVGLPFMFVVITGATPLPEVTPTPPFQQTPMSSAAIGSPSCTSCDDVDYKQLGESGGECCVNTVQDAVSVAENVVEKKVSSVARHFIQLEGSEWSAEGRSGRLTLRAKLKRGLQLNDKNDLLVTKPGYYFVYSRVSFHREMDPGRSKSAFSISYSVFKNDDVIDQETQTCFSTNATKAVEHTLYSQTVLHLNTGDVISIKVRQFKYLAKSPPHRLGMFFLSN